MGLVHKAAPHEMGPPGDLPVAWFLALDLFNEGISSHGRYQPVSLFLSLLEKIEMPRVKVVEGTENKNLPHDRPTLSK
jgi:hypothetical protein